MQVCFSLQVSMLALDSFVVWFAREKVCRHRSFFGWHIYFLGWTPLRAPPPQNPLPVPPPKQKGYQSAPFFK